MKEKRVHDLAAAGAGDLGTVPAGDVLGACPSCDAELRVCTVRHPHTGRVERALQHPVPFCAYFGKTDPTEIEQEIERRRS
jgi:hypothetical protein